MTSAVFPSEYLIAVRIDLAQSSLMALTVLMLMPLLEALEGEVVEQGLNS